jgi:SAM-dependent methyltransferase
VSRYERDAAAAFFDEYGEREWARFESGVSSPVNFEIHRHYLDRFVRSGDRVLEVGAGPGRFTLELARIGARTTVVDVSPEQLRLNAERAVHPAVEERVLADVLDLSRWRDGEFDVAVCYGGPISYVLDRAEDAIAELLRVTRDGGLLLFSVMSRIGPFTHALPVIVELAREHGITVNDDVIRTGILPSELSRGHLTMRLFRWSELEELLARQPCDVVAASASSLNVGAERALWPDLEPELRDAVVRWEIELAAEPGALNAGEHIIVVARKR